MGGRQVYGYSPRDRRWCMTYSRTLWALGQFMLHWGIMTATTSMRSVIEVKKQLLTHFRAQDAPHALGGALAEQFSWSASHGRPL